MTSGSGERTARRPQNRDRDFHFIRQSIPEPTSLSKPSPRHLKQITPFYLSRKWVLEVEAIFGRNRLNPIPIRPGAPGEGRGRGGGSNFDLSGNPGATGISARFRNISRRRLNYEPNYPPFRAINPAPRTHIKIMGDASEK